MLMNHLPNVDGEIPKTLQTGQMCDVSKFMHFHFWQEVFVATDDKNNKEELARWCYPAENVGDELTYMVLLDKSQQLVARSNVRPAKDPLYPNLRLRPHTDDLRVKKEAKSEVPTSSPTVETVTEDDDDASPQETGTSGEPQTSARSPITNVQDSFDVPVHLPRFSPEELLGLTYLHHTDDDQHVRATIVKKILDRDAENHERIKMLVSYDDGRVEELMAYNELCDIVADQHDAEEAGKTQVFTFRKILEHSKPLKRNDPMYMGSRYNVKVLWEDGSITWQPVAEMIAQDKVTMAEYAKEHGLLNEVGWKKCKTIAKRAKILQRMVNANKRAQRYNAVIYKFGVRLPRNVKEAIRLDEENKNTYWQDAMKREKDQLLEYKTFHSVGIRAKAPQGYQEIPLRWVFDVKETLLRKAR